MKNTPKDIQKAKESWLKAKVEPTLQKSPEVNFDSENLHSTIKERLYIPPEDEACSYLENIGFPGEYPFTRGIYPTMYRSRHWTMRQYAGYASAKESNKRYHYLLKQGQTGLSVAFDLPTQMGFDSDHAMALGEVGRVGVAIDSLGDMRALLKDLPLEKISTSMTINATAPILLALYIAVAKEKGVSLKNLRGTVQNDILKEYIARGTYIYPPQASLRLITDLMDFCSKEVPQWNTVSVSGYHIREAGSTAVQEVAFTLANAITYVEAIKARDLSVEKIASRLSFFFNVHNNVLEEVAKFRAARRLWAKIMKERFGVKDERAMLMRFHAQTAGATLTAQQPQNNVARVTLQALAAVLGGAQSLHTNSRDEALGLPTEEAATIALRTQQIIAHESGVDASVDPLGGSYLIEAVTDRIEREVCEYLAQIDSMGGMVRAIEKGYPQREIQNAAYEYQKQIESQKRIVVGVNRYQMKEEKENQVSVLRIDPKIEEDQVRELKIFKEKRSSSAIGKVLSEIKSRAEGEENLLPAITLAVEKGATLGEISDTLREVFGVYHEVQVI